MTPVDTHPGMLIIVMHGETLVHDGCHRQQLVALKPKQCLWAPTKRRGSPAEVVLGRGQTTLPGFAEIVYACSLWSTLSNN